MFCCVEEESFEFHHDFNERSGVNSIRSPLLYRNSDGSSSFSSNYFVQKPIYSPPSPTPPLSTHYLTSSVTRSTPVPSSNKKINPKGSSTKTQVSSHSSKTIAPSVDQSNLVDRFIKVHSSIPTTTTAKKYVSKSEEKKPIAPNTSTSSVPIRNGAGADPLPPNSFKPPPLCSLNTLPSPSTPSPSNGPNKTNYVWAQKGTTTPLYSIPDGIKKLIEKDVPEVLRKPLTPSTYGNYFAALLYAEDYYIEKWNDYCLHDVKLELHKAAIYSKSSKNKNLIENDEDKLFVAFRIDSVPEKRPFLLSRDFVLVHPSGKNGKPFQGILYRVVKSNLVLAEFGDDFHRQHSSTRRYDVSFSFNRVCLKRCHQAVASVTDPLFRNFLFPSQKSRISWANPSVVPSHRNLNKDQVSAVCSILSLNVFPPFLVVGQLSVYTTRRLSSAGSAVQEKRLSATGLVIREAVLQVCRKSPGCRILISAPTNNICDVLMKSLMEEIHESEVFRANAAFREIDGVPYEILPLCPYNRECFTCPPLQELRRFKVVLSTFVSSFRLHNEGITSGHFSHIFLVDASSTTEPETMVALANLADEKTVVVVTGATNNYSGWVRSDIARNYGLKISYFHRLLETAPYSSLDPMFVACIKDNGVESGSHQSY
ncbi:hypothetical protein IFM89_014351 [Coptis chinensis]|uniref:Helicase MOV-10-like beta-barrel domain-containing protein n=1 Tax=Coptis chinensis TaxID=261450 RepID=A0A835IR22_9MAGN|nr:hypothetical protein IFM89_014351 [Coptis chinensis]